MAEKHHGTIEIIRNRSFCGFLLLLLGEIYIIIALGCILGTIGIQDPSIENWVLQPFCVSEKRSEQFFFLSY